MLDVVYDYRQATKAVADEFPRAHDLFGFDALLPTARPKLLLPTAGGTPLVEVPAIAKRLGLLHFYIKDESRNPSRCLKDRATAVVATAMAPVSAGATTMFCASAGNAAISLATYAASAGLASHVYVPARVTEAQRSALECLGATVHVSAGDYDDAFRESEMSGGKYEGWFSRNCAVNPFLVEGKKTAAFEISQALDWRTPDIVVAPVGDGCTLGALGKGFRELTYVALSERVPRLVGAQSAAMQPLVQRLRPEGSDATAVVPDRVPSWATSIAVRHPRNALRVLAEVRRSHGTLVAVTDAETQAAQATLSSETRGTVEFTSATALAALERIAEAESLDGLTAVLVLTSGRLAN